MRKFFSAIFPALLVGFPGIVFSQTSIAYDLHWGTPVTLEVQGSSQQVLRFQGCTYTASGLPVLSYQSPYNSAIVSYQVSEVFYDAVPQEWEAQVPSLSQVTGPLAPQLVHTHFRKQPYSILSVVPIRRNAEGKLEKIVKITLSITQTRQEAPPMVRSKGAGNSVLANGNWYKVGITTSGVYKLSYEYLQTNGILSGPVSSDAVRVYGNGGGMLPEENFKPRKDDLVEDAVKMQDGGDGSFGPGDYVLFYGQGPHTWTYNSSAAHYQHAQNIYSDTSYYFITIQGSGGLRMGSRSSVGSAATYTVTASDDYRYREDDSVNVIHSGRGFLGDYFNFASQYSYNFTLDGVQAGSSVYVYGKVAARCVSCSTTLLVKQGSNTVITLSPGSASPSYTAAYCTVAQGGGSFTATGSGVTLTVQRTQGQEAWLDYLELNYRRDMTYSGQPFFFRDQGSIGQGISQFTISGTNASVEIWDITDPTAPVIQQSNYSAGTTSFRVSTDSLMHFAALEGSSFPEPAFVGAVANQNLHALTEPTNQTDLIIVTHPGFLQAAQELADFHLQQDGLIGHVVTTDQIYNEYSSGSQDISAIRDFVKMYYDKAPAGQSPRYLLLLGDGSYDYKTYLNRTVDENGVTVPNTNFVPAFETLESFDRSGNAYASDDFYALLDTNEGLTGKIVLSSTSNLDIGVGRMPVATLQEALDMVQKIKHYEQDSACMKDWRNVVTFTADDMEDGWESSFFTGSQTIASQMDNNYPVWNVDKIYLDSYQQINNAGQRYPDANTALNDRVNRGSLLINYIGHGGELGWTSERLLGMDDINSWTNYDNLATFLTATCTFARFDNPGFRSAGEILVMLPDKGGIGLFGTVRAISIVPTFNRKFFDAAFRLLPSGERPRLGDIIMLSKQPNPTNDYGEWNILLFGDPALRMAYPEFSVVTDSINGIYADTSTSTAVDTMMASQLVTITGHIADNSGNPMTNFDGILFTSIFDKPSQLTTLANDPAAVPFPFTLRKNIIFKGKTTVSGGYFRFTFQVPLDINYMIGQGKISYYAENGMIDAHGFFNDFAVGSSLDNCQGDGLGPQIGLFMNDTNFVDMGITDASPMLLVKVFDPSGINTVGNGIGHDIVAILDGDQANLIRLNDYYEADIDDYRSGEVNYRFNHLSAGIHSVEVQVWDGCNNVSTRTLNFAVTNGDIAMIHVYGYPNPFIQSTTISFEHNRAEEQLDVSVMISDIQGHIVRRMQLNHTPTGYRDITVSWDGADDTGHKMAAGVYVVRVQIRDEQGQEALGTCKLVLVK